MLSNSIWSLQKIHKCYSDATNQTNTERAKMRHEKAISLKDATTLKKQKGRPSVEAANRLEADQGSSAFATEFLVPNYRNMTNQPVEKMKKLKIG